MSERARHQGLREGDFEIVVTDEIRARYQASLRAVWMRMSPRPRACFSPALLAGLARWTGLIRTGGGSIAGPDGPAPLDYVVNASDVPGVFNFGGDLELFTRLIERRDRDGLMAYGTACVRVVYDNYVSYNLPLTTISLVQGECLGGGFEAALSSDIVVAERQARFGFPEVLFNLFPGMGAYSLLQRRAGRRVAERLIASGSIHAAEDLLELGVIDLVVDSGRGETEVEDLIRRRGRSRNGLQGIASVRRRVNPLDYEELLDVVRLWSDCALRLAARDLKLMQRLVSRQSALAGEECRSALTWPTDP